MAGNGSGTVESPTYSAGYKALVLALLLATYTFNFIDRSIINIIGQAIKVDLKLTDTQLGLLGGFYFAILYTLLGIPIARIAERTNRVSVISVSLVIWSAFTALCGTAGSFATLAAYRFGVGFGEAGGSLGAIDLLLAGGDAIDFPTVNGFAAAGTTHADAVGVLRAPQEDRHARGRLGRERAHDDLRFVRIDHPRSLAHAIGRTGDGEGEDAIALRLEVREAVMAGP